MPILPERPLRLRSSYPRKTLLKAGLVAALCAAMGVFMGAFGAMRVRAFADERALWTTGTAAADVAVDGEVTTHEWLGFIPVGREYEITVRFADAAGVEREGKIEVMSLTELDTGPEPELRYDPADPARVALSWTAEAGFGRWAWEGGMTLIGVLCLGGGVLVFRAAIRTVASARACARRSDERELPLVKLARQHAKGKPLDRWTVTYTMPPGPRGAGGKRTANVEGEPIVIEREGGARVVALVSPDAAEPTFPTVALEPYEVSPEERTAFEGRLAAELARSAALRSA